MCHWRQILTSIQQSRLSFPFLPYLVIVIGWSKACGNGLLTCQIHELKYWLNIYRNKNAVSNDISVDTFDEDIVNRKLFDNHVKTVVSSGIFGGQICITPGSSYVYVSNLVVKYILLLGPHMFTFQIWLSNISYSWVLICLRFKFGGQMCLTPGSSYVYVSNSVVKYVLLLGPHMFTFQIWWSNMSYSWVLICLRFKCGGQICLTPGSSYVYVSNSVVKYVLLLGPHMFTFQIWLSNISYSWVLICLRFKFGGQICITPGSSYVYVSNLVVKYILLLGPHMFTFQIWWSNVSYSWVLICLRFKFGGQMCLTPGSSYVYVSNSVVKCVLLLGPHMFTFQIWRAMFIVI